MYYCCTSSVPLVCSCSASLAPLVPPYIRKQLNVYLLQYGLQLAHLLLLTEDLDSCQHQLVQLLKNDKENEKATVMMADLMFRKNEYDQAMYHFQQLLEKKPGKKTGDDEGVPVVCHYMLWSAMR